MGINTKDENNTSIMLLVYIHAVWINESIVYTQMTLVADFGKGKQTLEVYQALLVFTYIVSRFIFIFSWTYYTVELTVGN